MELKEFVKNTIVEIVSGVIAAKEALGGTGTLINPVLSGNRVSDTGDRQVQYVEMNVAISIEDKEGSKKGLGISKVLSIGFEKSEEGGSKYATTVKFSVPVSLPSDGEIQRYLSDNPDALAAAFGR